MDNESCEASMVIVEGECSRREGTDAEWASSSIEMVESGSGTANTDVDAAAWAVDGVCNMEGECMCHEGGGGEAEECGSEVGDAECEACMVIVEGECSRGEGGDAEWSSSSVEMVEPAGGSSIREVVYSGS